MLREVAEAVWEQYVLNSQTAGTAVVAATTTVADVLVNAVRTAATSASAAVGRAAAHVTLGVRNFSADFRAEEEAIPDSEEEAPETDPGQSSITNFFQATKKRKQD